MSLWWLVAGDCNAALGHRHNLYSAPIHRFYILMRRATISHSSEAFKHNQRTAYPRAKETRIPSLQGLISIPLALTKKGDVK